MSKLVIPKCLYIVFFTTFLYSWAFLAQAPLLPFVVKEMNADNSFFAKVQSAFSLVQIVGGLLAGPMLDKFGGKVMLLISFVSSVLLYAGTALSTTPTHLLISRLPALTQHAVLAARTIVSHVASPDQKSAMLGYLSAASGVGFVTGPMSGGKLASMTSLKTVAAISTIVSAIAGIIVWIGLPADACHSEHYQDPTEKKHDKEDEISQEKGTLQNLILAFKDPKVVSLLITKALITFPSSIFSTLIPLVLRDQFELSPQGTGNILSYVGFIMLLSQVFLIKKMEQSFGEGTMKITILINAIAYIFMALAFSSPFAMIGLLICLIPTTASSTVSSTINTGKLSNSPKALRGSVIAIDMALFSVTRMIAPLMGNYLMERIGFPNVILLVSAMLFFAAMTLPHERIKLQ